MNDGTHFYVDAGSGEIVARRTRFWRVYDFMWGLHIMDLQGREDTHNPWIVSFALLALVMVLLALVLLPLAITRAVARSSRSQLDQPAQPARSSAAATGAARRPAGIRGSAPGCSARP